MDLGHSRLRRLACLVVAFDDIELVALRWLSVGPDRLYLTVQQAETDIWVADVELER